MLSPLRTERRPTLPEFMDAEYSVLPGKAVEDPKWKTRPEQKGLMLMMCHPGVRELFIAKPSQVGVSEMALGLMMWVTIYRGESWVYFMPTDSMARRLDKSVKHWIASVKRVLKEFVPGDPNKRVSGSTQQEKHFTRAIQYYFGGATSANTSQFTVKGGILDEFNRVKTDIDGEGGLLGALRGRFGSSREGGLIRAFSTHTDPDSLLVKYIASCGDDVFECELPCPGCDQFSVLHWGEKSDEWGIKFDDGEDSFTRGQTVRHVCKHCGDSFKQQDYRKSMERCRWVSRSGFRFDDSDHGDYLKFIDGEWVKTKGPIKHAAQFCEDGGGLYGVGPWEDAVVTCIEGTKLEKHHGDTTDIQTFENVYRQIPFVREIETAVTVDEFLERREEYSHKIPKEVQALTIGIDFGSESGGYSYYQIDGHGAKGARWAIEKRKIAGDCQDFGSRMYTTLDQIMKDEHEREDGVMLPISLAIMDGRHVRDMVMRLAALDPARRIVVFGSSNYKAPLFDFVKKRDWDDEYGCYALSINPHVASEKTYYKLGIEKGEDGYYRFPIDEEFNRAYAKELGADKPYQKATPHGWVTAYKKDHSGVPNEGHDVAKYNTIAIIAGIEHGIITINNNEVMERIEIPNPVQTQQPALDIAKGYDAFGNMFR